MGISIINNLAAIGAQRAIGTASSKLGESLAKLSSGLRINSAKDDPSGLAISERFRTQIRGLARASANAQDAISFLQTAEGALNETHSILQRMRELAVQAANGVLTSNDRLEIQKEVDQLSQEVNRIANSTEFNTKKLLDGSGAALWSADDTDISAVITGQVAEGNYRLEKNNEPTVNHVIKSDIFQVKAGAQGTTNVADNTTFAGWSGTVSLDAAPGARVLTFDLADGTTFNVTYASSGASGTANAAAMATAINQDTTANAYIAASSSGANISITLVNGVIDPNSATMLEVGVDSIDTIGAIATGVTTLGSDLHSAAYFTSTASGVTVGAGDYELYFNFNDGTGEHLVSHTFAAGVAAADAVADIVDEINTSADAVVAANLSAIAVGTTIQIYANDLSDTPNNWTVRDAVTGTLVDVLDTAVGAYNITTTASTPVPANASDGLTGITNPQGLPAGTGYIVDVDMTAAAGQETVGLVNYYSQTGSSAVFETFGAPAGHVITTDAAGYLLIEVVATDNSGIDTISNSDFKASNDGGVTWFNIAGSDIVAAAGGVVIGTQTYDLELVDANVQVGDKALYSFNGARTAGNDTIQVTAPDQLGSGPVYSYGAIESSTQTVDVASMNATTGEVTFGSVDFTFDTTVTDTAFEFDITASGGIATGSTQLYFVDRSYDNVGNFIWGDSGQYLTIYNAAGDNTSIFIDGADSLQEVADKVENAITGVDGLNMGSGDSSVDDHVADFVSTPIANSDEAVQGTIVIRSPKQGINGKLSFSAPEDVLKFFSFADIQDPRDEIDPLTVTVTNAHTGELIGSDTVSDGVLRNVIEGVEVHIDSNVDVDVAWNSATRSFDFTSSAGVQVEHLHVVDRSVTFQIGANRGQTTQSYVAQMDGAALGTNNVLVINQELASLAIAKVDNAINKVSSERARIGGNISRLNHTINNLNVQAENAVAAESRIRDLDMALEMTEFTKQQLLLQASTAMLAQANQVPQILLQLLR